MFTSPKNIIKFLTIFIMYAILGVGAPLVKANSFSTTGTSLEDTNGNTVPLNSNGYVAVRNTYVLNYFGTYIADYMPGNPVAAECKLKVNGKIYSAAGTIDSVDTVSGKTHIEVSCEVPFSLEEGESAVYTGAGILTQSGSGTIPLDVVYDPVAFYYKKDSKKPVVGLKLIKNVSNCTLSKLKARHADCKITVSYKAGDPAPGELANAELKFWANNSSKTSVGLGPNANGVYHNYSVDLYDIAGVKGTGSYNITFSVFAKDKADNTNTTLITFESKVYPDPKPTSNSNKKASPTPTPTKVEKQESTVSPTVPGSAPLAEPSPTIANETENRAPASIRTAVIVTTGGTTLAVAGYLAFRYLYKKG